MKIKNTCRTSGIIAVAATLMATSALAGDQAAPLAPAVPFTRAENGHFVTTVQVGGQREASFVVDTGAGGCAVYDFFAKAAGLEATGTTNLTGQTGSSSVALVPVERIDVAGVPTGPLECVILPDRRDGAPHAGIIGLDSMGSYVVMFDMPNNRLAFHAAGTDAGSLLSGDVHQVEARILPVSGLLALPVELNGVTATAVLDSGARRTVINSKFAAAAGVDMAKLTDSQPLFGATDNKTELKIGPLGTLNVAGDQTEGFVAAAADLPVFKAFGVADEPAMILGLDYLAGRIMVVDFPNNRIYLAHP